MRLPPLPGIALGLAVTLLPACARPPADPADAMTGESFAGHVRVLSSDAFEGRAPASVGETCRAWMSGGRYEASGAPAPGATATSGVRRKNHQPATSRAAMISTSSGRRDPHRALPH